MKNPLLAPEIREMLAANQFEEIGDFFHTTPASVTADFLGALDPDEVRQILLSLRAETRAEIFVALDEDVRLALLGLLNPDEIMEILSALPVNELPGFLRQLPREELANVKAILEQAQGAHFLSLFPLPELAPETTPVQPPLWSETGMGEPTLDLNIYKTVNGTLQPTTSMEPGCWINVLDPAREQLDFLSQRFRIPMDFLSASLDMDEIARIESEDDVTLVILKIPYFDESNPEVPYFTLPVGVILTRDLIITVCARQTNILLEFANSRVKNFSTVRRDRFVLQLLYRGTLLFLKYLKQINNAANIIQKKLEQSSKNKQLIKLLNIEKSLVYFTTSLKSNALMLERLQKLHLLKMDEETQDLIEDIVIESKQAMEMANIYSDILSGMMDAFASIISNNLNIVMKVLASIAIITTIPILIASLYGMNVRIPLQESPYAFLIVILASFLFCLIAVIFFVRKDWL